jgi:hypothetical protein
MQTEVSQAGAGPQQMRELLGASVGNAVTPEAQLLQLWMALQAADYRP